MAFSHFDAAVIAVLFLGLLPDRFSASASAAAGGGVEITYGSVIKLMHQRTKFRLHSHDISYGSGSEQQSVTGFPDADDSNSYWIVRPKLDSSARQGDAIPHGTIIRLQHMTTRRWLHSHLHASPISDNLEVSCFGGDDESETGDHWKLEIEGSGKFWRQDQMIRLLHIDTKAYLHSHNKKYQRVIAGQLEGVGFSAGQLQHFHHPQCFGGSPPQAASSPAIAAGACCGGAPRVAAPRQRVRARRGQATDPHSIAERLRRERIAERMKALQELVPNANKTDKASMLDEIIDYVKFLQLQVKVLSMSRLGGSAAVSPLMADAPSEGRGSAKAASGTISETESLVARLMEEDMGLAMQYLQGKGLCLMPISLASAISTVTSPSAAGRTVSRIPAGGDAPPSSPSMSVLTVQSAIAGGGGDTGVSRSSGKDVA